MVTPSYRLQSIAILNRSVEEYMLAHLRYVFLNDYYLPKFSVCLIVIWVVIAFELCIYLIWLDWPHDHTTAHIKPHSDVSTIHPSY